MESKRGESQISERHESFPTSPLLFIGKVGGDVFLIFFGGACIYKRASRGFKWVLNIISQTFCYVIGC